VKTGKHILWLSGDWSQLQGLRQALAADPSVEEAGEPAAATGVLHAGGADVAAELASVRERSDAPIVFLARGGASALLEAALDAKVADVLILPQPAEAVLFAVRRAAAVVDRERAAHSRAKVVTVFSPKGGSGKSVIATNLAIALAARGRRTLLLDLDLQFGDVGIMLGLQPHRTIYDLLAAPGSLDVEKIAGYATEVLDVDVIPAPLKPEDAESIVEARVGDLLASAKAGYDVIVVDTPSSFNGAVLAALDKTDELLLVCTPEVPALKNARLTLQTLELLTFEEDRIRIVANRAGGRGALRVGQVEFALDRAIEIELPEDEEVPGSVNRGQAVLQGGGGNGTFAKAIEALAGCFAEDLGSEKSTKRRFALGRRS